MFEGVKPLVSSADLAICHMETVYGSDGDHTGNPAFKIPPQVADGLAATGYDACSTASNHSLDDGAAGVRRTLDALDLAQAYGTRDQRARRRRRMCPPSCARAARWSPTSPTPTARTASRCPGAAWSVNLIDRDRILADARAARKAGADVVVVSLHWGTNGRNSPTPSR